MEMVQHFIQALSNIRAAKLRSFLAVLGILVGTASVVTLITCGQLATRKALAQFETLGTDLLAVSLYNKNMAGQGGASHEFGLDEVAELDKQLPQITQTASYINLFSNVSFDDHVIRARIVAAQQPLQQVIKIELAAGRFVSFLDHFEQFCVVGHKLAQQLAEFTNDPLVGQQLKVGKYLYTIIGVAKPWAENAFFNNDINMAVIIPLRGASLLNKKARVDNIIFKLKPKTDIDNLIQQIKQYIGEQAPDLNIFPRSPQQIIASMQKQGRIFTLLLAMIGGISLLVGGIGVMNVMLVSVTERKREIGIRMAIGAKRRDIQILFVIEAIVLSVFGGSLGIVVGIVISYIISIFTGWGFAIFLTPPLIGFLVSAATGIFFGFYPAYRASQLNPIDALRYE